MRLLDKQAGRLNMTHLGLLKPDYERLTQLVHRPHGIILVTGPTGSGKTTTLYAALSDLNDGSKNILTAEDPIEYQLEGIGQTQVNTKVDMTFARALKAMLRQDPDVVMVGEIRDLGNGWNCGTSIAHRAFGFIYTAYQYGHWCGDPFKRYGHWAVFAVEFFDWCHCTAFSANLM